MKYTSHIRRNPGAGNAGASEIINLCRVDGCELNSGASLNQAARKIALKGRVSHLYASVIAEHMGVVQ